MPSDNPVQMKESDFLQIYNELDEKSKQQLLYTLKPDQKANFLRIMGGVATEKPPEPEIEKKIRAADFLPVDDEKRRKKLDNIEAQKELRQYLADIQLYPADMIAQTLLTESPVMVAVLLSQIDPKYASKVIRIFPKDIKLAVVNQLSIERRVNNDAFFALVRSLKTKTENLKNGFIEKPDGLKHIREILKRMNVDDETRLVDDLQKMDREVASDIVKHQYEIQDLVALDAKDLKTLFQKINDHELWALALRGVADGDRKQILSKLSLKSAGIIAESLVNKKSVQLASIDHARALILRKAFELSKSHEIILNPR